MSAKPRPELQDALAKVQALGDDALLSQSELAALWGVSDRFVRDTQDLTVTALGPREPRYRWGNVKQTQRARERAA